MLRAAILMLLATRALATAPDLALEWNRELLECAEAEDRFLTLKGVRAAAMMHLAMHDALNACKRRFEPFALDEMAASADPALAAAHAAHAVAVDQYPDRAQLWEELLARQRERVGDEARRATSRDLGVRCARAVLERRSGDGWDGEAEYKFHPMGPGVYAEFNEHSGTPQGFVFGAGWAKAVPFALERADQFRSPPPPAIDSAEYTQAFDEVKLYGADDSPVRSEDQAHLAMWWKDFVENSHNRLARDLVEREQLELWAANRLFALINTSVYDAYVNVFDNKFHFNHWRPYTAIRWAEHDGNPETAADPEWNNLHHHTYAFPSYPSAHGCACAAAMTALEEGFGDDYAFTMRNPTVDRAGPMSEKIAMDPPTRSFESFRDAARECGLSRLYLGIHFRYDSEEGVRLGRRIGESVLQTILRPHRP